jgi:signal transduction histidine kinase
VAEPLDLAGGPAPPSTYFAPAERADPEELARAVTYLTRNPVVDAALKTFAGLLAVLNPQRQIVAVNDALLKVLGLPDLADVIGLRPGEALACVHARDHAGGCGTGRFCATCGAAIAIVACQVADEPVERDCIATVRRGDGLVDLYLTVRASPIMLGRERFVLLFLQDVSEDRQRAYLERAFFHDLNNLLTSLRGAAQLLAIEAPADISGLAWRVDRLTERLLREVEIQRTLIDAQTGEYRLRREEIGLPRLIADLGDQLAGHPARRARELELPRTEPDSILRTDQSLLLRVLGNMLTNALEATPVGGRVRLDVDERADRVTFRVWNAGRIPPEHAVRVFQRHFSTKSGNGRGIGTYAMKLFGERYLGGRVAFTSSEAKGTEFILTVPRLAPEP